MERENHFCKDEIAHRLQLPMERIDILIDECLMPVDTEENFVAWGLENFDRLWEEMKAYGPIAQMEANAPVSFSQPSGGN
jgi:hypothetical protein